MSRVDVKISGGTKIAPYLNALAQRMKSGSVRVGFLEKATYPAAPGRGTLHVAQVAFWNEFGTVTAPARPFFRQTVAAKSPEWGRELSKIAEATNFNSDRTLRLMGERIKDQLVTAITDWPADNADSTAARKGFNKGLIETTVMQRSVDYEVSE